MLQASEPNSRQRRCHVVAIRAYERVLAYEIVLQLWMTLGHVSCLVEVGKCTH